MANSLGPLAGAGTAPRGRGGTEEEKGCEPQPAPRK